MSLGTLVLGLLNGLTVGLLAVGLVLVYKSNRFLNMAHAQMGALSALLLAKFVLDWHWNFWLCFFLTVVIGTAVGLVVERLFGRLRRQGGSTVRLLLLSVAVSEVLLGLTFVPALGPDQSKAAMYPQPFESHLRIGHVVLSGMSVLTAVLVPVIVLGLAAFLRYSVLGKGIRAAANNPDAARLCGISVARVSAVTWAIAGALSAVSAILEAPNQPSFDISAFGPYLLMLTLGAAAFGAFVSLPAALVGGLVLGLVGQIVSGETSNGADGEVAVFAVILIVVLLRGREIGRVFALTSGASDSRPLLRVPELVRTSPLVRYQRIWLGGAGLFAAAVLPNLPYFRTEGHRFLLALVLIYALIGVGLTMLVGWAGQVSLGHFALVGFGAYLAARWGPHWSLPAIMVVAGILGAGVMIVVGLPALRVGGLALAVTTMGFAVICADWLYRQGWFGSSQPFVNVRPIASGPDIGTAGSKLAIYYVALVVLTLGVASASALRRWGPGRLVIAVRDNEQAVQAFGMNPATVKLAILAVSGFYAAVAGVLWGDAWGVVSPQQFTADLSISIIAIPVVGGLGSLSGALAAAALLYMGTFFLGPELSGLFGSYGHNIGFQLFLAGFSQIGVLLSYPAGLAGLVQQKWQRYLERRAEVMERWSMPGVTPQAGSSTGLPSGEAVPPVLSGGRLEQVADIVVPREKTTAETPGVLPLVTEGIIVRFGGLTALNGPDIEVRPGEVVGLIGPNGAGKTTLMNVISGVLRSDAGSVRLFGREVADLPPDFRAAFGLARTFQDARLFGGLSVLETIQVAMAYRHKVGMGSAMVAAPWAQATEARSQDDADRILARFGLKPWREALTSELSTGTRRICDLAAQVAAAPKILLLDEPTAGVAQREAEAFGPLLRRIRDELDCSVLIVEHDMPLLMGLCDRVYAMEAGAVIAEGTPEGIRNDPAVVASYLGSREAAVRRSGSSRGGGSPSAADTTEMLVPVTASRSRGRSKS